MKRPKKSGSAQRRGTKTGSPEVLPPDEFSEFTAFEELQPGSKQDSQQSKPDDTDEDIEDADITDEEIYAQMPVPSQGRAVQADIDSGGEFTTELDAPTPNEMDRGSALSIHDPLKRYMEEIRRYPLLDPEQETLLAAQMHRDGDMHAARRLVQANLRLVVKIAFEYRNVYSNILDLIQEGNVGLIKAVSKFDPTKGARLGYYASWWIRSYMLKYLLDNFRLVKIGTTQAQKKLFYHLMREKERLEAQGLLTGPKLLAERLNVRERDVVEMEQRLSGRGAEMSLDTPIDRGGESSATQGDFLADGQEGADDRLARGELLKMLEERLPQFEKTLNDKEKRLLNERLLSEEPKTLQEIADRYGLTRERARQIETKVIQKLRDFLKNDLD